MGPSYRSFYQLKQLPSEPIDPEFRALSPKGSQTGPSFSYASSSRRRRSHSKLALKWFFAGVLSLCVLVFFIRIRTHVTDLRADQAVHEPIDVVAVSLKPSCVTREAVASLNRYLQPRTIHIITTDSNKCNVFVTFAHNIVCHLQDAFLDGLTVERVGDFLQHSLGVDQHKQVKGRDLSGWYMQQLLKLGSVLALPGLSEYYVVWDLDMILLSPIELLWHSRKPHRQRYADSAVAHTAPDAVTSQTKVETLVNIGGSISLGYISSFRRLTKRSLEFAPDGSSFVTHWMVVYKPYLREFLQELSGGSGGALDWVWRILGAVEYQTADLGFSEYASYISWVRQHYPQSQRLAPRKTWVRHPFGQTTVKLLRLLRSDRCCCPSRLQLQLLRAAGYVYTGYEVGHIPECRYDAAENVRSYGL